jgi:hypothetical protein
VNTHSPAVATHAGGACTTDRGEEDEGGRDADHRRVLASAVFGADSLCVADRARLLLLHSGARVGVLGTTSAESTGSELTGRGPRCARYRA